MKSLVRAVILMALVLPGAQALEITVEQTASNLTFPAKTDSGNTTFTANDYFLGTDVLIRSELSPGISLSGGYQMDLVSRKRIFTEFLYQADYVTLGVGPFFGLLNTEKSLGNPGIASYFRFSLPNLMFFDVELQSTLSPLIQNGDYYQNLGKLGVGISLPNGLIGLSGSISRHSELLTSGVTSDDIKAVEFTSEVFFKNNPLKFGADFRFQNYSREFHPEGKTFSIYSGIIVAKINWAMTPQWEIYASSSSSVLNFGYGDYSGSASYSPDPMAYIFSASLGLTWTVF